MVHLRRYSPAIRGIRLHGLLYVRTFLYVAAGSEYACVICVCVQNRERVWTGKSYYGNGRGDGTACVHTTPVCVHFIGDHTGRRDRTGVRKKKRGKNIRKAIAPGANSPTITVFNSMK